MELSPLRRSPQVAVVAVVVAAVVVAAVVVAAAVVAAVVLSIAANIGGGEGGVEEKKKFRRFQILSQ